MAAASKWRLIRSPRELRSSRMDYIQNIAIGTSARTKTSSSFFFFFFFTFLVPLCIQKTRVDDVWHGGYYAGMKRVHVVFLLSKRSGVTLCWILDRFNRVCFRTDAIFDDDTTITNASKRRTALFFFDFESSARFQRAERRWNVSYPRFFSSYARKHVYGGFVHVSWTFLVREMTCERRIRNLHFQKSQRANSSLFDDASRVSKRLKKWEKRVVTDQILLSFTLK